VRTELIIALAVLAAIGAAAWSFYAKKKRREELLFIARQLGLAYLGRGHTRLPGAPVRVAAARGRPGNRERALGMWQGIELLEFDYWFYTESADSEGHRTKSYSCFSRAVTEIDTALSPLTIGRESLLTRLADAVGLDDIGFETQEFNDAFNVKSKDRTEVRQRSPRPADDGLAPVGTVGLLLRDLRAMAPVLQRQAPADGPHPAARHA
jgi:hypothetical protein